ncbi:MAG TPA: hypothetical protein VFD32_14310 [Dehalococcoidia bacterium]|nr:hypothetical protein [Dehalococcoidia bacterium]
MTPLNVILGNQASAILVLSVVGALLLACACAAMDLLGGSAMRRAPAVHLPLRETTFVWIGLPALLVLAIAGGALGAVSSGSTDAGRGLDLILWCANAAFIVAVLAIGLCSPLARHWALGLAAFAAGMGALMLFLVMISALGLGDAAGLITDGSHQLVFGVAVGGVFLGIAVAGAALLALAVCCAERLYAMLAGRRAPGAGGGLIGRVSG